MPIWIKALIIIAALPVLAYPALLAECPADVADMKPFLWFYPIYVVVSTVCAWAAWRRRPEVTWILIAVMLLTHAAMWTLVLTQQ
ncbi:MAG: hypothetical protein NC418_09340 [Muribaculaceae bacterium]|nr:hypothetical protein [Muribaculaceae bacterium]